MIVSIRGTNGAGKSTLVRSIMKRIISDGGKVTAIKYPADENKKRPLGYICSPAGKTKGIFVVGHYEPMTANGGIDTTPSLKYAYKLALEHHELGLNVIMEGKNFTESPKWILDQHGAEFDIRVALIDLPVAQCIKAVRKRGHKIKEETIKTLHAKSREQYKIFEKAGVTVFKGTRDECFEKVKAWLRK
jgi:ABC-type sugar transport system ATPase subunit